MMTASSATPTSPSSPAALSRTWLRMAVLYFVAAVLLGVGMGASGNHGLRTVHAHANLLGWVSMALFALVCGHWPAVAQDTLAKVQFWLYQCALPVMLGSLAVKYTGGTGYDAPLGISAVVLALAVVLWCVMVWRGTRQD